MGCVVIAYVIVLVIDLLVGSSLIVWKCGFSEDDAECKLAAGGTIGSVAIWLLLLLVCPFCVIKCDVHESLEKGREKCKRLLQGLRPQKERFIYIQSEIYLPTTLSLNGKGHKATYNEDTYHYSDQDKATEALTCHDHDRMMFHPNTVYTFNEANAAVEQCARLSKYLAPDAQNT